MNLKHVVLNAGLRSFPDLKAAYALPQWMLYYPLHHTFQKQFPLSLTLELDPVEGLLTAKVVDKSLSAQYFHLSIAPTNILERTFGK